MPAPLSQEEFDHLLEAYAFNHISESDRQRLLEAVLESDDRSLDFARVQELRDQFTDPAFRTELLEALSEPTSAAWWRQLLSPQILVPMTGSVAAAAAISVALMRDATIDVPLPPPPASVATQSATPSTPKQRLPHSAEIPEQQLPQSFSVKAADTKLTTVVGVAGKGRSTPEFSIPDIPAPTDIPTPGPGTEVTRPSSPSFPRGGGGMLGGLAANVGSGGKRTLPGAFDRPASEASSLSISLPSGHRYLPDEVITVRLELPKAARLYAVVLSPTGTMHHVYPDKGRSPDARRQPPLIPAGPHVFSFPVSAPGLSFLTERGVRTLRVFIVFEGEGPREMNWTWIAARAQFVQAEYYVDVRP
jgi:hypothetical protein